MTNGVSFPCLGLRSPLVALLALAISLLLIETLVLGYLGYNNGKGVFMLMVALIFAAVMLIAYIEIFINRVTIGDQGIAYWSLRKKACISWKDVRAYGAYRVYRAARETISLKDASKFSFGVTFLYVTTGEVYDCSGTQPKLGNDFIIFEYDPQALSLIEEHLKGLPAKPD